MTAITGVDELLEQAADSGAVPGVAAFVADRDGLLYQGAAGRLRIDGDAPVTRDTVFRIASMTKAIATVGALQLVEQGRLSLDQTVASVQPAFGELQVLTGFDGDQPRLRPPARQATVRQLMSHTAGCGYYFLSQDLLRYHQVTGLPNLLDGKRASLGAPLVDDPGARWEYGINVDWLGQVIEAVSGQTLDVYLGENVLTPLGMTETTFRPSDEQRSRMIAVHARTPDGGLAPTDLDWPQDPEFWPGGHGLYSTAGDYARFLRALLRGGELDGARILRPETLEIALSDQLGALRLPEVIHTAMPELTNDIPSLPVRQSWGLGFHLFLEDLMGMRSAGSGDWAGIFNTYFWLDTRSGITAGLLSQVLPFFDAQIIELLVGFEQAVYAQLRRGAAV